MIDIIIETARLRRGVIRYVSAMKWAYGLAALLTGIIAVGEASRPGEVSWPFALTMMAVAMLLMIGAAILAAITEALRTCSRETLLQTRNGLPFYPRRTR